MLVDFGSGRRNRGGVCDVYLMETRQENERLFGERSQ
jgi:hypothetical protein